MFETLKEKYTKLLSNHITVSLDDLTDNEKALIEKSFELFEEKLEEIKLSNDEVRRLAIELANTKAMYKIERNEDTNYNDE
jgi:hypothetical protein